MSGTGVRPAARRILQIGAGAKKVPRAVTVDINAHSNPDVVWDLNHFPYPFANDEFDLVVCEHVIEHLDDVIRVMEELHRVTRAGGRVVVRVPHFSSLNANTDPTHRHAFSSRSFDYLCLGTPYERYDYSSVRFRKLVARMDLRPRTPLRRLFMRAVNSILPFYEEHLAYILTGHELIFVLEVVKDCPESASR